METKPYMLHALSPLHVGVGQSSELIDLPIARLKGSNIPYLPGSSIKGVLREALFAKHREESNDELYAIFGPDLDDANDHAGALVCADARLFALPVRSYMGTFAYVTCPLLLAMGRRDLVEDDETSSEGSTCRAPEVPKVDLGAALVVSNSALTMEGCVYLEDLDLKAGEDQTAGAWANHIAKLFGTAEEEQAVFTRRFVIVDDETMTFFWETATQTDTRVRIEPETRTVADKALWIEESLPPETLLLGVLAAERSRRQGVEMDSKDILIKTLPSEQILQFGGKATVGRGRCRMVPL